MWSSCKHSSISLHSFRPHISLLRVLVYTNNYLVFLFYTKLSFSFLFISLVPPTVKAVNHVVGAPIESHVLLECVVEVFPKPLNGWYRNDGKYMFLNFII